MSSIGAMRVLYYCRLHVTVWASNDDALTLTFDKALSPLVCNDRATPRLPHTVTHMCMCIVYIRQRSDKLFDFLLLLTRAQFVLSVVVIVAVYTQWMLNENEAAEWMRQKVVWQT